MHHQRFKSLVATLMLFAPGFSAWGDYGPVTLYQLMVSSDIAIQAQITSIADTRYDINVARNYRQTQAPRTAAVLRPDTASHGHSAEFSERQYIVLFARQTEDSQLLPVGKISEGALLRDADYVYVQAMSRPPATLARTSVPGQGYLAYPIEASVFDQAVDGFYRCYQPVEANLIKRICGDSARSAYRQYSWLALHFSAIAERVIGEDN